MAKESLTTETKAVAIRDAKGRFVPGHPSIKTPKPKRERPYLDALYEHVDLGTWHSIIGKAIDQALDGDRYARKWLADYIVGPPVKRIQAAVASDLGQVADIDNQFVQVLAILQQVYVTESQPPDSDAGDVVIDGMTGEVDNDHSDSDTIVESSE